MAKWIRVRRSPDEKGERSVRADRVVEVLIHDPKRVELRADGQWFIWQGQTALEFAELADSLGIGGE